MIEKEKNERMDHELQVEEYLSNLNDTQSLDLSGLDSFFFNDEAEPPAAEIPVPEEPEPAAAAPSAEAPEAPAEEAPEAVSASDPDNSYTFDFSDDLEEPEEPLPAELSPVIDLAELGDTDSESTDAEEVSEEGGSGSEPAIPVLPVAAAERAEDAAEPPASRDPMAELDTFPSEIELSFSEELGFELPEPAEEAESITEVPEEAEAPQEDEAKTAAGIAAAISGKLHSGHKESPITENAEMKKPAEKKVKKEKKEKKPKKQRSRGVRIALRVLLALVIMGCLAGLAGFGYAAYIVYNTPEIDPENIYASVAESSTIYTNSDRELENVFYSENRRFATYSEMPEDLIDAVVALEDKTFWSHRGFNWVRIVGAVYSSLTGNGQISGTSTITQQLARNVYLADRKSERSIERKIQEMWYAHEIEKALNKEQIIEAYLNTIYLGFGSYGVEAAAENYFSKSPSELTLLECASLAALPQSPDTYSLVKYVEDPSVLDENAQIITRKPETYIANDQSKDRRDLCLDLMLEQGYITQEEHDGAYGKDLIDFIKPDLESTTSEYAYFVDYLLEQVSNDLADKYDISQAEAYDMIYTGGLNIYSTIDTTAQKTIVKEFNDSSNYPSLTGYYTDGDDNIISESGSILLYDYDNFFNGDGDFKLKDSECRINEDGSLTILRNKRLNIYTTEYGGIIDYSLEFKNTYVIQDGVLYIYNGGFINIPAEYKSLDGDDNLVISADFFADENYVGYISRGDGTATIHAMSYTLPAKTIQPQSAMVIVEVGTGKIKAMVGGRKQSGKQLYNRAVNPRQPGSSIKPLTVYSAALQKSFEYAEAGQKFPYIETGHDKQGKKWWGDYLTASSAVVDEKMTFDGKTWPKNATNSYRGYMTVRQALQQSINTCAVKIQLQVGNQYSMDLAKKYGLTTLVTEGTENDMNSAALALGGLTHGVTPLEMAAAYATFPNNGVYQSPICYNRVTDRNGNILLEGNSESRQVLDPGVAWIMTDMLRSVITNGIGYNARTYEVASGGKTGTTSSQYDIWFDGFTPNYAAALWIGTDVNIPLTSMSGTAAALWGNIMNQIPNAMKGEYKDRPDNVLYVAGEYYTSGTEKGRSTYIAEMKKKEEEEKKKKEEEAKKKAEAEAKKKAEEEAAKRAAEQAKKD